MASYLGNKLSIMRQQKRFSDLTITVGSVEFQVHKNVMSAGSDYFDKILSEDNLGNNIEVVDLKEVDVDSVGRCIDYIYTGNASITFQKSEQLLHAANIMQLPTLCEEIAEFLKANLSSNSFFVIKKIAVKFSLKNLEEACDEYAVIHLGSIAKKEDFSKLDEEYVMFLITCKKSSYSEDSKLKILLQWIKADVESRADYLIDLAKKLDVAKISASYGSFLTRNDSLCSTSIEFIKLLYLADKAPDKDVDDNIAPSSPFSDERILLFDSTSTLQAFDPVSKKSAQLRSLCKDMKTSCYTAVVLEDFVYVLRPDKKVYRVNLWEVNSSWTEMPNMNKDHGSNLRAVVHANFIYVHGNYTLERFGNHWQNIGSNQSLPCYGTLVACRDDIYIIGSYVIKYSPSNWYPLRMESMNVARKNPAATVYNGRIYVAGGRDKISSAEFFDPDTNTWTNLAQMRIPRCNFSLCVVDKILFAVGNNGTLSVEKYDLGRKQWIIVTNVPSMSIVPAACNTIRIPLYY